MKFSAFFLLQLLDKSLFRGNTLKTLESASVARHWGRKVAMLVLTRRINESIVINDDVSVLVVEIRGDRVRLGIEAPKDVTVHRKEIYDAIKEVAPEKPKKRRTAVVS